MAETACTLEVRPKLADLRPLLRSAVGTPTQRALAVLSLAARLGLPAEPVRLYVTRSNDPDLAAIAKNRQLWALLAGKARQHVAVSSSAEGRAALRREIALRLVARILNADVQVEDLTPHRLWNARVALGVLGTDFVAGSAQGFPGSLISEADLGVQMGKTRLTGRATLQTLQDLGWLACTKRPKGSSARFKLTPLDPETKAVALNFLGLIERLGDLDLAPATDLLEGVDDPELATLLAGLPDDARAVEILLSAQHPAWAYGRVTGAKTGLTHRHWLVALADAAGTDADQLGVTTAAVRKCRRELDAADIGPTHPGGLTAQLDAYAAASGAASRHAEAWAARTAEKAARKASLLEVRAARAKAQADRRTSRSKATAPKPAVKFERVTVNLPGGFDESRHRDILQGKIVDKYGTGFTIETIDAQAGTAMAIRQVVAAA